MADSTILIKKINVGTATHFIDALEWNGYKSTDIKTINGESILASGGGNIDIVKKAQLDETNAHITENEDGYHRKNDVEIFYRVCECVLRSAEEIEDRYFKRVNHEHHKYAREERYGNACAYSLVRTVSIVFTLADVEKGGASVTEAPSKCLRDDKDREHNARRSVAERAELTVADEYLIDYIV